MDMTHPAADDGADRDHDLDHELDALGLGELAASPPPPHLRGAVLSTAIRRRPPGTPVVTAITPQEAFRRAAADLDALLADLTPAEWRAPTFAGTVQELVGHLSGIERYMLAALGEAEHPNPARDADHHGITEPDKAAASTMAPADVRAQWRSGADAFLAAAARVPAERETATHGLPVTTDGAVVLRAFEVWTHDEDIRRATGRPLPSIEPDRLRLMSSRLLSALPGGMLLTDRARSAGSVDVTLTGPGGGSFSHRFGDGGPHASITVDVTEVCRLAARRVTVADLPADIAGDASLAEDVLVGLTAFAMD